MSQIIKLRRPVDFHQAANIQTRLYFARRTPHGGGTGDKKEFDIQLESN